MDKFPGFFQFLQKYNTMCVEEFELLRTEKVKLLCKVCFQKGLTIVAN